MYNPEEILKFLFLETEESKIELSNKLVIELSKEALKTHKPYQEKKNIGALDINSMMHPYPYFDFFRHMIKNNEDETMKQIYSFIEEVLPTLKNIYDQEEELFLNDINKERIIKLAVDLKLIDKEISYHIALWGSKLFKEVAKTLSFKEDFEINEDNIKVLEKAYAKQINKNKQITKQYL
ncbi:MAG: hypothetical protein ACRC4M_02710 [Mycoplasma sp.]